MRYIVTIVPDEQPQQPKPSFIKSTIQDIAYAACELIRMAFVAAIIIALFLILANMG
jgi:hypothetical protein